MVEPATKIEADPYEQACNEAIAMCNGNMRSAVKALLIANEFLETEMQLLQAHVSSGFARGRLLGDEAAAVPADRKDWYD